ncbi:hypothetical protein GX586_15880, partial [bacterium]|nr:hypothetical protein [bacterium]
MIIILAVLTILTILAATFTVMMQLESQTSNLQVELNSLDLLLDSGLNHAVAVLADMQATGQKVSTMRDDNLRLAFGDFSNGAEIRKADQEGRAGKWIPVLDSIGRIRGRYRVAIEDEAGKVNLNKAHMLEPSKGSAWDTGEVSLPHALGVPPQIVEQVVRYQYGPNSVPGARGDDDRNNVVLMADGLDNNANGLIDEDDEGVDDPGEYTPWQPMGDDRRFTTVSEAMGVILSAATDLPFEARNAVRREIPRRATLYSIDMCGSPTLPMDAPADINAVMGRECRTRLRTANRIAAFENVANRLDELAANVVDYRDENHVLTTVGGAYGVEAVNFNELLANDGTEGRDGTCTFIKQSYDSRTVAARIADKHAPFCAANLTRGCDSAWDIYENPDNLNYYAKYRSSYARRAVDIKMEDDNDRTRRIRILGPGKIKPSGGTINEGWTADDREVYDRYTLLRQGIGRYGPRTVSENPGFDTEPPAYKTFEWPPGFFINSYVSIAFTDPTRLTETTQSYMADPKVVKITDSTRDGVLTLEKAISRPLGASNRISRCIIWNWNVGDDGKCGLRGAITSWTFQGLQPRKYYLPVVNGWPRHYTPEKMGDMGFAPYEQIRSDSREHINHKWTYGGNGDDATPVRTSSHGYLDVFLRGGNTVSYKGEDTWSYSSVAWGFTFVRPEVIELINVSPRAISLRNWTLTFNTGSLANDIGTVQSASGYLLSGTRRDFNPVIPSNGYFYMVNNLKLFQAEFNGTPKKTWGGTAGESNPLWEIPSDAWGVQYRIDKAQQINRAGAPYVRVYVSGNENFRSDQFKGEVFEAKKLSGKAGTSDGTRYEIQGNGRNYIEFTRAGMQYNWQHYQPSGFDGTGADTIMILGMPAKGGLVSMTLKNEYKQIVSRTISYAYLNQDPPLWYGRSTEKVDPTHYSWVVRQRPSIGGKPNEARNASMRGTVKVPAFVKNGPLNSIAEIALVRKGEDFENVGVGVGVGTANRTIASLANSFGSSFIRLEAGDDAAERQGGWKVAADEVSSSSQGNVGAAIGGWEPGQWRGHTITFVTGDLRGESYPIVDNTQSGIDLRDKGSSQLPRSAPSQKQLRARKGDRFVLGPGYRSAACYSRRP